MPLKRTYRINATGTHCAIIDIDAASADEAATVARTLNGDAFEVLHLHHDKVEIRKVVLVGSSMEF